MRLTMLLAGRVAFVFVILSALLADAQDLAAPAIRSTMPFQLRSEFLVVVSGKVGDLDGLKFILDTGSSPIIQNLQKTWMGSSGSIC